MLYWVENTLQKKYLYAYKDASLIGYDTLICPDCNRSIKNAQYSDSRRHLILEGGTQFPDFLQFCGAGNRLFIVSERTLDLFQKYNISGYDKCDQVLLETTPDSLIGTKIPNYYSLNISGKIDLDMKLMHLKKKRQCPNCEQFEWSRMKLHPIILNRSCWDGSDLCSLDSMPGLKICSEHLKEIVCSNKLTGFSFREAREQ